LSIGFDLFKHLSQLLSMADILEFLKFLVKSQKNNQEITLVHGIESDEERSVMGNSKWETRNGGT
jgi:hypothetical protein